MTARFRNNDITHLREFYDEKFRALDRELEMRDEALKIQAKEYERRLEALNHEATRILTSQQKSISVEKFDGIVGQIMTRSDQYEKATAEKISDLSKRVYIITGAIIVIEFVAKFLLKL